MLGCCAGANGWRSGISIWRGGQSGTDTFGGGDSGGGGGCSQSGTT